MASNKNQQLKPPRSAPQPMPRVANPALDGTQRGPLFGAGFGVPGGVPSQPPPGRVPNLEPQASYQRVYPVYGHTIYESQAIRQNMTLEEALACADVLQRLFLINLEVVLTPKLPGGQVAELTPFNEIPGVTSATVGEWCVRIPGSNAAHILGDIVDQCDGTGADAMFGIVGVYQGITGVPGSYQDVRAMLQLRRPVTSREVVQEWQRIFS